MRYFWIFFLICGVCFAETIDTARGTITFENGDVLKRNSMWEGQVENVHDVIFNNWNFARKQPHTEVFVNCSNLAFYQCNLNNVEIPEDATVIDCLTIHQEKKKIEDKDCIIIECGDNKTRTYEIIKEDIDIVEEDLLEMGITEDKISTIKQSVVEHYVEKGKEVLIQDGKEEMKLIKTEETPDAKSYKHIKRFIR